MVEGPCCKLKGEKIRSLFLQQVVKSVVGNAVQREEKSLAKKKNRPDNTSECPAQELVTSFARIIGKSLDDVITLGKELFLFFGDACLRIHFLMAGTFKVNNQQVDTNGGKNLQETSSLAIQFIKDTLTFYKCAAEIRPSSACRQKYMNLRELDICSPTFSSKRAVEEIMMEQERQLCDVLLDQDILPGVGNIIKNEALFDSGLKPDSKVKELKEEHVLHLVKMTRDFSMLFYKCRKNGTNLSQHMRVYQKGKCGECESKITVTRMGEDSERITYFCPTCQTNDINRKAKLKLPTKNSLLGWLQTSQDMSNNEEWSCSECTFINSANQSNCSICLHPKLDLSKGCFPNASSNSTAASKISTSSKMTSDCSNSVVMSTPERKRKLQSAGRSMPESEQKKRRTEQEAINLPLWSQSSQQQVSPKQQNLASAESSKQGNDISNIPACCCPGKKSLMRQTFKENGNKGRWFFTCATTPASKRCNFFQWADEKFPVCMGHGKVCALRTVMKQGPNNGRKFFCCPMKKDSCKFFEWAFGYG